MCVLCNSDFWAVLVGAEATLVCSKVFHQFVNCYTEKSGTWLNNRSSPTVLIFSLFSHLDIEIRSITFIEDALYEISAGEDTFHACLLFRIKLLNQSCSYQVGRSFNNWWRLTLDWIWISFHPGCSPQICQIQLLISFNNHLQGSSKNLCSAFRFYLGTLKVYFVTTNEKSSYTQCQHDCEIGVNSEFFLKVMKKNILLKVITICSYYIFLNSQIRKEICLPVNQNVVCIPVLWEM